MSRSTWNIDFVELKTLKLSKQTNCVITARLCGRDVGDGGVMLSEGVTEGFSIGFLGIFGLRFSGA